MFGALETLVSLNPADRRPNLAAERATPERVEALRKAVERMDAGAEGPCHYPEADVDFHHALAEAAGNRYLVKAILDLRSLLSPLRAGPFRGRRGARLIG